MTTITPGQTQKRSALLQSELGKSLTAAFSSLAGNSSIVLRPASPGSLAGEFAWMGYDFEPVAGASLHWGLSPADRLALGHHLLAAKGQERDDDVAIETLQQLLMQGVSTLSSLLNARSKEQPAAKRFLSPPPPNGDPQFGFEITGVGSDAIPLAVYMSDALIELLAASEASSATSGLPGPASPTGLPNVNNLELLLDVEMPVSISFGRAQLPLKDVLRLSIGSLVELDRTVSDPVEIIVSNSVIARGEVVVVDGNLGVRIDQVMSRQERLRNLI